MASSVKISLSKRHTFLYGVVRRYQTYNIHSLRVGGTTEFSRIIDRICWSCFFVGKIGKGTKLVEAVVRVRDKNTEIPEWEELKEREQENRSPKNENKAIKINYVNRVIDTDTHEINKGCFRIDPESIFIGELEIKFLGDKYELRGARNLIKEVVSSFKINQENWIHVLKEIKKYENTFLFEDLCNILQDKVQGIGIHSIL